ncbi:MAG TPA: SRPBCC family protein [Gaiellaceae bacterium]|nr:SRPBCC family protein [Gaiellaceae bacterium]
MPPAYRFLDRWVVPAPIERVYDTIGDVLGYESWWTDFVIRADGDEGPPAPGKRNELLVKAYLPYKVNFGLEVIEAEQPRRILSRLSKDFNGTGEWTLEETADGTVATLDWRPSVNHPLIRYLTPALRPLFRSNHNWAMRRGERQIREHLATQGSNQ